MRYSDAEMQAFRWGQSYAAILAILSRHGVDNALGEGDFWLLDDNYGSPEHLLYIFRIGALTQDLVATLQALLRAPALDSWTIRVSLDLPAVDGAPVPPEGLIISAHAVEEHWNRQALCTWFGDDFHWPVGWAPATAQGGHPTPDFVDTPDPAFHAAWLEEQVEWQREHDELVALLATHAGEAMSSRASVEVLGDSEKGGHQIILRDSQLASSALADSLSALLRSEHWFGRTIILVLDPPGPAGERLSPECMLISGEMVNAASNAVRLKQVFGERFDWSHTEEFPA